MPRDDVVIVANFSHVPLPHYQLGFPRPGQWHIRFNSDSAHYDEAFGDLQSPEITAVCDEKDDLSSQAPLPLAPILC